MLTKDVMLVALHDAITEDQEFELVDEIVDAMEAYPQPFDLVAPQALGVLHNGGRMGFVGVPHYKNRALGSTFMQNISVAGGAASATTYDKQFLLKAVLDGDINPGRVFTSSYKLEDIDKAYKAMDERKTIKSMIVMD